MQLSGGDRGTRETLAAMAELVRDAARRPDVRRFARAMKANQWPLGSLWRVLRSRVVFEADPPGQELVRHPSQLLAEILSAGTARGDCDDRAMLGASLARAMGYQVAFVTIGRDPAAEMEHVYFAVRVGGRWTPLDPQEVSRPGREVHHARRWLYPVV